MSVKLFVGNLSFETTKEDLTDLFSPFGNVEDAFLPTDRETGRARGFGFVTLSEGSDKAISELNETMFNGRNIRINVAEAKNGGGGGGRGGRGGGGGGYDAGGGGGYSGGGGRGRGRGRGSAVDDTGVY